MLRLIIVVLFAALLLAACGPSQEELDLAIAEAVAEAVAEAEARLLEAVQQQEGPQGPPGPKGDPGPMREIPDTLRLESLIVADHIAVGGVGYGTTEIWGPDAEYHGGIVWHPGSQFDGITSAIWGTDTSLILEDWTGTPSRFCIDEGVGRICRR